MNLRKCINCLQIKPKSSFFKICKHHKGGELILNPDNKTFGRSAYVCKDLACVQGAFKKGKIYKCLRAKPVETLQAQMLSLL